MFMADGVELAHGEPAAIFDNPTHPRLVDFLGRIH